MKYKRLNFIADQINEKDSILDVGTDHAIIPIILLKRQHKKMISASDININPLQIAENNLRNNNFLNKVNLIKSNGIKDLELNYFDLIIITGMGGKTISNIISSKEFIGRYILQPTTDVSLVRNTIMNIGMKISNEWIIKEGKIYNVIIEVVYGREKIPKKNIFLGPKLKDKNYFEYYQHILEILERNSKLSNDKNLKIMERNWIKEVLWNEIT